MDTAHIEGNRLFCRTPEGRPIELARAEADQQWKWFWVGCGSRGRAKFGTPRQALLAAAKAFKVEIIEGEKE